ncbi:DUF429 domain-containing protein [Thiocapsa sp.]|uniref:DUF429 domain-containing protein n=1 Tax=Thiocapsa sp. TaxID=2024551 RepID=UPI002BDBF777|nr:DUF429 domain-containing protein [Thiocapsa sp.]HSO82617.1 DUF429 domain-containing protein [Thiocapsa sp.]
MKIYGIDFTSRPSRRKPITCVECCLGGLRLKAVQLTEWRDFEGFEAALQQPGPWIAGIDFPFGQSRTFIENIGWPDTWTDYVDHAARLGREGFRTALDGYRSTRTPGDKEHRRATDRATGAISPQKLYGTPVGLMFFEGAPRLRRAGVRIPGLKDGDPERIVVEAYPGVLARRLIGKESYKQDMKSKQTAQRDAARRRLLDLILDCEETQSIYGLKVQADPSLAEDPSGDRLDALLCAIQAAWAWTQREQGFGMPAAIDPLEGAIADPIGL